MTARNALQASRWVQRAPAIRSELLALSDEPLRGGSRLTAIGSRLIAGARREHRDASNCTLGSVDGYVRNGLRPARTSSTRNCGCSHAAKWPPLGGLL